MQLFLFCSKLQNIQLQVFDSIASGYRGVPQMMAEPNLPKMEYGVWTDSVDQLFQKDYAISIEDIGVDQSTLRQVWETGETPAGYVQWFGRKYDLTGRNT